MFVCHVVRFIMCKQFKLCCACYIFIYIFFIISSLDSQNGDANIIKRKRTKKKRTKLNIGSNFLLLRLFLHFLLCVVNALSVSTCKCMYIHMYNSFQQIVFFVLCCVVSR